MCLVSSHAVRAQSRWAYADFQSLHRMNNNHLPQASRPFPGIHGSHRKLLWLGFGLSAALALTAITDAGEPPADDPFADEVISYEPGTNPAPGYTNAHTALGSPTRFTGGDFDPMIVSVMNPAWRPAELVSIGAGGSLVVKFNTPVTDDPLNPHGIDLLVFGNAMLVDGSPQDGVCPTPAQLLSEGGTIELSANGEQWILVDDVQADALYPTEGWLDHETPYAVQSGAVPADFTKPVDPSWALSDFDGATYVQILEMYRGSGGGAGIDIGSIGLIEISFVRITNPAGNTDSPEIDGFADVAPKLPGDVNGDMTVDVADLLELLSLWGDARPAGWDADFNGDGAVDVSDLLTVLSNWGTQA